MSIDLFQHHDVARQMDVDFIYFDLALVTIWMVLLIVRKRYKELIFGLFGFLVVWFVDYVVWFTIQGTRHIEGPTTASWFPHVFLIYFSFTYGMIMFSFAPLMFNKKINKIEKGLWAGLMYGGWLLIAFLSKWTHINDGAIYIYREMSGYRIGSIIMAVVGYLVIIGLKAFKVNFMENVPWWYFAYLFGVGIFIHFSMESTLLIAGIRPSTATAWAILAFNSLIEFNTGIPVLFILWIIVNLKEYSKKESQIEEIEIVQEQTTEIKT